MIDTYSSMKYSPQKSRAVSKSTGKSFYWVKQHGSDSGSICKWLDTLCGS